MKYEIKDIPGYEGIYKIDTEGNVYSLKRNKILKPWFDKDGYHKVAVCRKGTEKHVSIHRIMCEVFIPNPQNKPTVNHKDGNKKNNSLSNLEWATISENSQHAYDNDLRKAPCSGLGRRGIINSNSKKINQYTLDNLLINTFYGFQEAGRRTGINPFHISSVCSGSRHTAGGFIWRYAND
jgi:hypothetical protein